MFSYEYCGIFKITCLEEHLRTTGFMRPYFDTINLKKSGFCTAYSFMILVSERKYKNNLKNRESQNKIFCNPHIYVYVMFYYEIQ